MGCVGPAQPHGKDFLEASVSVGKGRLSHGELTGLADKVAHYRTDSEEFSRHVTRIGEFFGQKPEDLSIAGEFPKRRRSSSKCSWV